MISSENFLLLNKYSGKLCFIFMCSIFFVTLEKIYKSEKIYSNFSRFFGDFLSDFGLPSHGNSCFSTLKKRIFFLAIWNKDFYFRANLISNLIQEVDFYNNNSSSSIILSYYYTYYYIFTLYNRLYCYQNYFHSNIFLHPSQVTFSNNFILYLV